MAAALVKVIRGGRSGAYSQLPAIGRGILEEGVLPHLGSARAAPAAGMGRLMHTKSVSELLLHGADALSGGLPLHLGA
ncbi:hypothetical protein EJB05_01275, partial [Eragrostis curvula]